MAFDTLTLIALIISCLALLTTTCQLLGQYFATADGYRKCQPSVMGTWGKRTRLRWRWKEFRFETLYSVPHLSFASPDVNSNGTLAIRAFIEEPRFQFCKLTKDKVLKDADRHGELVGWVYMMQYIGLHDWHARRHMFPHIRAKDGKHPRIHHDYVRFPKVDIMARSWDFVPSDVVRPLAITTVSAVAVATRRLGMIWKQFEPSTGAFHAEGNHQVIASTAIRGLGTVLQYIRDPVLDEDPLAQAIIRQTSPLLLSDDLGFGRIGRCIPFGRRDFHVQVGNIVDVATTLPSLFSDTRSADAIISTLHALSEVGSKDWMTPANDIVPFLSVFLGVSSNERPIIPWPNSSTRGLTHSAFRPFEDQLIAFMDKRTEPTTTGRVVLGLYQSLLRDVNGSNQLWEEPQSSLRAELEGFTPQAISSIYSAFRELEVLLSENPIVRGSKYQDIIAWHVLVLCNATNDVPANESSKMRKLFLALPELSEGIRTTWALQREKDGFEQSKASNIPSTETIEDAWFAMMLRAMCWQRLHMVVRTGASPLPSEFAESKFPVYIG